VKKRWRVGDKLTLANGIEATLGEDLDTKEGHGGKSKRLTKKRILEIAAETCSICAKELERSKKSKGINP
jgi:hypothetical protein